VTLVSLAALPDRHGQRSGYHLLTYQYGKEKGEWSVVSHFTVSVKVRQAHADTKRECEPGEVLRDPEE
jgi:hypothetical protein